MKSRYKKKINTFETTKSKRQHALELSRTLLRDLDLEKISASNAVQRLQRIARLTSKKELMRKADEQLTEMASYNNVAGAEKDLKKMFADRKAESLIAHGT